MMPAGSRARAKALHRAPLLAAGFLAMASGAWLGLVRLGWNLPLPRADQLGAHGPLMVCGFLGTLISLERAVALGSSWGYAAPASTAIGALLLAFAPPGPAGSLFITAGSAATVLMFVAICRRQPALFAFAMAVGAAAWFVGNARWMTGAAIFRVVFWWVAFLVLTIAGERLELNRVLRPVRGVRGMFAAAIAIVTLGAASATFWPAAGVRTLGVGLLLLTWWLARYDVARRTIRQQGLTRFMAVCLLGGYLWLGVGGAIAVVSGSAEPGVVYDAMLHAIFVGFAMSMVFAHAPVIFPAVLAVPIEYRAAFYAHVAVLHASLALRVAGDLVESLGRWRAWGGALNAVALLVFMANTVRSAATARPAFGSKEMRVEL